MYNDTFSLHPYNDSSKPGPHIWKGHYGKRTITVIQEHQMSGITEADVTIEWDADYKEDSDPLYNVPSKKEIAQALDQHLNRIYD